MWRFLSQQQQRGAQLHARERKADEAPADATKDRAAQDHDYADLDVSDGEPQRDVDYPASEPPHRAGDITPDAPGPHVDWDQVVQPERADERRGERRGTDRDDLPLPEGK